MSELDKITERLIERDPASQTNMRRQRFWATWWRLGSAGAHAD